MAATNASTTGATTPGSRGPAPPLPEKPPSVAERTRLLKSSFRKEEVDKPKVPSRMDTNRSSPLSEVTRSAGSSVSSLNSQHTNGDREESPTPGFVNGVNNNTTPTVPSRPVVSSPTVDNKEVERQALVSKVMFFPQLLKQCNILCCSVVWSFWHC